MCISSSGRRSFEDTKSEAADVLDVMQVELRQLTRLHRRCVEHNAVNTATQLEQQITDKQMEIDFESEVFRHAFY